MTAGENQRMDDMNAMTWMKGAVVALGISLGGSAAMAAPGARGGNDSALFERQHRGNDNDRDGWNDGWLNDRQDRFDRHERRMFRLGQQKIAQGQSLQSRGETLLQRPRWTRSVRMARQAHTLIQRGESLEREGRILVRRARS